MAERPMSKAEYNAAIKTLGTTAAKFAIELGISERHSYRYACGETKIPPSTAKLIRLLVSQHRV